MWDLTSLLGSLGAATALLVIGITVWAESGLLVGLLLPGDTLLFTVGFFAARGDLPLWWSLLIIFMAAVLGDNTGFLFGKKTGPRIFARTDGILFRKDQLARAEAFYKKHGGKTVLVARIVPYARTLVPIIAGASNMNRARFVAFNILGAALWAAAFVGVGYVFGVEVAERISHYATPVIILGILFALSPTIIFLTRNPQARQALRQKMRKLLRRR